MTPLLPRLIRSGLLAGAATMLLSCATPPPDASAVLARSSQAMGAGQLNTLRYAAEGTGYTFGQAYKAGGAWPKITLHSVTRSIDYGSATMRDEIVLSRAEPLGGGGYPLTGQQRNEQFVSGEIAWNQAGTTATPGPRFVTDRLHQLWITPHGVLKAAMRGSARASADDAGVTRVAFDWPGRFTATAYIAVDGLVRRVESTFADPVLGDTPVVTTYDDYRGVSGLMFPFHEVIDVGDPRNLVTITTTDIRIRNGVDADAFARPHTDDRLTIAATTEVPFHLLNNHIYIDAKVDGKPVRMIVDTGGLNLLTPAAAAELGLATSGKMAARGVGEKQIDLAYANGTSLEVGGVKLARPVFYVIDMGALGAVEGVPFDGLVGFELFQRLVVRIDYPGRKLVLSKRDDFTPPAGAIAVPFELRDRTPVVSGEIDGIPARITIDTGARNSLTTTSPFTKQHGLEKRYQPKFETVTGWGVGGPVKGKPVRFKRVKMGEASIDDVVGDLFTGTQGALADPDSSANLGGGVLKRFVVTFDYRDKKMYLEPGPPVRDVFDRAGMFFLGDEAGLRIVAVVAGGPAERAGLAADDHITGIDREPVADRQTVDWRDILSFGPVGAKHVLTVDRAGKTRQVTLVLAELLP
jgi:predicted aspartyl protease